MLTYFIISIILFFFAAYFLSKKEILNSKFSDFYMDYKNDEIVTYLIILFIACLFWIGFLLIWLGFLLIKRNNENKLEKDIERMKDTISKKYNNIYDRLKKK